MRLSRIILSTLIVSSIATPLFAAQSSTFQKGNAVYMGKTMQGGVMQEYQLYTNDSAPQTLVGFQFKVSKQDLMQKLNIQNDMNQPLSQDYFTITFDGKSYQCNGATYSPSSKIYSLFGCK